MHRKFAIILENMFIYLFNVRECVRIKNKYTYKHEYLNETKFISFN